MRSAGGSGELKQLIADLPDDLVVRYNYDGGNGYPELKYGYVASSRHIHGAWLETWHGEDALILDEDPRDFKELPVLDPEAKPYRREHAA